MSLAVVVLPLVPVMTIDPLRRSAASLVRILGSIALATSPGRVVPPPRLVVRLRVPVAFPAQTAAVLRIALVAVVRGLDMLKCAICSIAQCAHCAQCAQAQGPIDWATAVQQLSVAVARRAWRAACSVVVLRKKAEPEPVI